jgi:hypothetical protein
MRAVANGSCSFSAVVLLVRYSLRDAFQVRNHSLKGKEDA